MKDERIIAWERVAELLSSEEVINCEELRTDLEDSGVSVDVGIQRLQKIIRAKFQAGVREVARAERAAAIETARDIFAEIATWPVEKVREWIKRAEAGDLGSDIAGLALAFHRSKEDKPLTESEARSLIADILSSKK
jgi:hypothetical protein